MSQIRLYTYARIDVDWSYYAEKKMMFTRNPTIYKGNSRTDSQLTVRLVANPVKATNR